MFDLTTIGKNEITSIIIEFTAAATNMKIYPQNHPQVTTLVDRLHNSLQFFFERIPELTLFIVNDNIIAFDRIVPNTGLAGESFKKILAGSGLERVTFLAGLSKLELSQFINNLVATDKTGAAATNHIRIGKVVFDETAEADNREHSRSSELLTFNDTAAAELKKIYLDVQDNKLPDPTKAKKIVTEFIKIYDKSISPLKILAPIKSVDEYTYVHITNVALLTICFADYLGFSGKNLEDIGIAALLHDVGKMFIPDKILKKPGPLDANERAIMETHTLKGAQYIGYQKNIPKLTIIAALEHHIKYDGSGYPKIKKNWRPNIASQIVSIADVYDAMRSKRPYQEAMKYEKILAILKEGRGSSFNPVLVENFLNMIES